MLVLTRKRMEKLYIGGDICVTVVRLEGGQVRLGIEAPRHVPVVRAELRERDRRAVDAADPAADEPRRWPLRTAVRRRLDDEHGPQAATAAAAQEGCSTSSASRNR